MTYRIAITEGDATCQWRGTFTSQDEAEAQLADAQAEFPDGDAVVEALVVETDENNNPVSATWTEV